MKIFVTDFAQERHFEGGSGTQINISKEEFALEVNSLLDSEEAIIKPSLYPFCFYVIVPNFTDAKPGTIAITPENQHYLKCAWKARRDGELPFLSKNLLLPHDHKLPTASHLAVIVYSREHLEKEERDFPTGEKAQADFGVVAVQANMYPNVELMTPATMIRNSMGTEFGGNGEDINQEYILESEEFWAKHASVMFQQKHPEYIDRYQGTTAQLAEDLGDLRYDAFADFVGLLQKKLEKDSKADVERKRPKLAKQLHNISMATKLAEESASKAWKICETHMK